MKTILTILALTLLAPLASARDYYMAADGNDVSSGTAEKPFATLNHAATVLVPGDTLWVRGGTYLCPRTVRLSAVGKKETPIRIFATAGNRPVFNFIDATGNGIAIDGAWWHLKGLAVTHAQSSGIRLNGIGAFRNTIENCAAYANENTGIHMANGAADNTILNCDSYENYDARKHGQDADGFGAKFDLGPGNRFIGCRAWNNSDDGYDCWYAGSGVRFENCYAWANGVNLWKDAAFEGNGNGFKLGQLEGAHVLVNCAVWDQPHGGFDLNGNTSGVTITNCTAFRCGTNFAFTSRRGNIEKNVLRNNISFDGIDKIDPAVDDKDNSWNAPRHPLTKDDFRSLDPNCLQGPRNPDGTLPKCDFLRLTPESTAKGLGAFGEVEGVK